MTYFIRSKTGDISSWLSIDGGYTSKFEDAMPFTYLNNALSEAAIGDDHVVEITYAVKSTKCGEYPGGEYFTERLGLYSRPWTSERRLAQRWVKELDANAHGAVLMGNARVTRIIKRVA